ncbi:hypothetical protein [Kamptonema formosum]|uniref:hypothetical protein n=1 Tax=Kamptonema formosum TaxID=331992 RepID=UPI0012DBF540|nr:hypothetical protein [Oscillatoria sp. PCC 10802]
MHNIDKPAPHNTGNPAIPATLCRGGWGISPTTNGGALAQLQTATPATPTIPQTPEHPKPL